MSQILRLLSKPLDLRSATRIARTVRWNSNTSRIEPCVNTDSCGIPLEPTWSVNELISSYPKPTITPSTLKKLHDLSALIPPEEGSLQHAQLTEELENLVKLVEAVKALDIAQPHSSPLGDVPDGRVWAEDAGIKLEHGEDPENEAHGRDLLRHATRTEDGFYVVDADRSR